jgi:hypothetical protein
MRLTRHIDDDDYVVGRDVREIVAVRNTRGKPKFGETQGEQARRRRMLSISGNENSVSKHEERTEVTYLLTGHHLALIDNCRQQVIPDELSS